MLPPTEQLKKISLSTFLCFLTIVVSLVISNKLDIDFSKKYIIKGSNDFAICMAFLIAYPFVLIFVPSTRELIKRVVQKRKWWGVPAVIYQTDSSADKIFDRLLQNRYLGYRPVLLVDSSCSEPTLQNGILKLPPCEKVYELVKNFKLKVAIICDYKDDIICQVYEIKVKKGFRWNGTNCLGLQHNPKLLDASMFHDLLCNIHTLVDNDRQLSSMIFREIGMASGVNKPFMWGAYHAVDNFQKLFGKDLEGNKWK